MLTGISTGSTNSVQAFSAINAFKNAQESLKKDTHRIF